MFRNHTEAYNYGFADGLNSREKQQVKNEFMLDYEKGYKDGKIRQKYHGEEKTPLSIAIMGFLFVIMLVFIIVRIAQCTM